MSQAVQSYFYPRRTQALEARKPAWQMQTSGTTGFTRFNHFDIRGDYNISSRDVIFWTLQLAPHAARLHRCLSSACGAAAPNVQRRLLLESHHLAGGRERIPLRATFHVNPYQSDVVGSDLIKQFGIQGIATVGVHNAPDFDINGVTSADLDAAGDSCTTIRKPIWNGPTT